MALGDGQRVPLPPVPLLPGEKGEPRLKHSATGGVEENQVKDARSLGFTPHPPKGA